MKLVNLFAVATSLSWALSSGAAPADDFCWEGDGHPGRVWKIDRDIGSAVGGTQFTTSNMLRRMDQYLQGIARHNRPIVRSRVYNSSTSNCYGAGDPSHCVVAARTSDPVVDSRCYPNWYLGGGSGGGPTAYAGCGTGNCYVILCVDGDQSNMYSDFGEITIGDFDTLLRHETGHTYGLNHVSQADEGPPADCNAGLPTGCGTGSVYSDGCDGEIMCEGLVACFSRANYAIGDARGLRKTYSQGSSSVTYAQRDLFKATFGGSTNSPAAPTYNQIGGRIAIWLPRMDCTRTTAEVNDCGFVRSMTTGNQNFIQVRRLNNPTSTGWGGFTFVKSIYDETVYEPDIAVNADASVAWVTWARASNDGQIAIARVDIDPSSSTYGSVFQHNISNSFTSTPPRIAWSDGADEVIVVGTGRTSRMIRMWNIPGSGSGFNATTGVDPEEFVTQDDWDDWGMERRRTIDNFDLDCSLEFLTPGNPPLITDYCSIVARTSDNIATLNGNLEYVRFLVNPNVSGLWTWEPLNSTDWTVFGTTDHNGVGGVTYSWTSGVGMHLHISASRRIVGSSQTDNTRHYVLDAHTMSVTSSPSFKFDAEPCEQTTSGDGTKIPGTTPYGGLSHAWCYSCGGTSGTIEATSWGHRIDDDDFCW